MNAPSNIKAVLVFVRDSMPSAMIKTHATADACGKKRCFYKSLPTRFQRDAFDYRLIARERDAAIYEQTWKGNGASAAFEIVRIRKREAFQIGGRFMEPAEVYPRSEQWGELGWTVPDKETAFFKLRKLGNARKKKNRRIP